MRKLTSNKPETSETDIDGTLQILGGYTLW